MEQKLHRIAVTGMGAVTPIGLTVASTWENMINGVHGIGPITRFDITDYKATLAAEVKDFDPRQYMEKQEVLRSDLFTQYAVAAACQAMEDSGLQGKVAPDRLACIFGSGIGGIGTFEIEHSKLINRGPKRVSPYFIPMMIPNMAAGTIAIRYNCMNSVMPTVTACATGSNAIGEAMRLIRHGYADAAITGGSEAAVCGLAISGFANMQAISTVTDPEAASLPFDSRRKGFILGEGAAALILEDYDNALARGATIYAEVCGYGSTCDAYHMTAPRPDAAGGTKAMELAMEEAGYTSADSVYVNAHGTGTPMNDRLETIVMKNAMGQEAYNAHISSTKSMTGHMLGAAGAIEAIACIQALCTGIIPPTIHLLEPDPDCDLNYTPNQAVTANITLALSNSLGFGGHNACLAFRRFEQ